MSLFRIRFYKIVFFEHFVANFGFLSTFGALFTNKL